jgi:hypothetical protein
MGLLKVPEFAEKYGLNRTNVYTYKKRGKLIFLEEGYIDEDDPINKIFIDSRETSAKVKVKPSEKEQPTKVPKSVEEPPKQGKRISRAVNDPLYLEFQQTNNLRNEKLQEEIRQSRLRNDRIEGRLVSVDAVKKVLGEVINRYKAMYSQQTEQLIRDTLNELQAGNEIITRACSKLTDISNESTKRSIFEIRQNMGNIVNESLLK